MWLTTQQALCFMEHSPWPCRGCELRATARSLGWAHLQGHPCLPAGVHLHGGVGLSLFHCECVCLGHASKMFPPVSNYAEQLSMQMSEHLLNFYRLLGGKIKEPTRIWVIKGSYKTSTLSLSFEVNQKKTCEISHEIHTRLLKKFFLKGALGREESGSFPVQTGG